jgi:hypothetical protein
MRKKPDLSKYKIEYGGQQFNLDIYGREDYEAKDGLWALSEKCAGYVIDELDAAMFFDTDEQSGLVRETVRNSVYSLIKFRILRPLDQQLMKGRESEM